MRAVLCAVVLLLACSRGPDSGTPGRATAPLEPTTRDSAGGTIHEHPGDAIDRAPEIVIESAATALLSGDDELTDVTGVMGLSRLADGRFAGFDGSTRAVRIFSAEGVSLASYGRRGEGPGEFRGVERIVILPGDTVLVTDWTAQRVTLVHPDEGIGRIEAIPSRGIGQSFQVVGAMSTGEWLMQPTSSRLLMRNAGLTPDTARQLMPIGVYRSGSGAATFDTIVVQHAPPLRRFPHRNSGTTETMEGPARFAAWPIAGVWDGLAVTNSNEDWQLRVYDATGAVRRIVRFDRPREPLTPGLRDSLIAQQVEGVREMVAKNPQMARFENPDDAEFNARNAAWSDSLPPFLQVVPSGGRVLWLWEHQFMRDHATTLLAIATDGRLLGRLTIPTGSRLAGIGDDYVALRTENDDGIATITVRRLVMP